MADEKKKTLESKSSLITSEQMQDWTFNEDHYIGGRTFLRKAGDVEGKKNRGTKRTRTSGSVAYLQKASREPHDAYVDRLLRSYYINVAKEILDRLVDFLFEKDPDREPITGNGAEFLNPMLESYDKVSETPSSFMAEGFLQHLIKGPHFAYIDDSRLPQTIDDQAVVSEDGEATLNRQQLISAGYQPIVRHVHAENVLDWAPASGRDKDWVKFWLPKQQDRPTWDTPEQKVEPEFYVVDREKVTVFDAKGEPIPGRTVMHNAGRVPLVAFHPNWWGRSPIEDVFTLANRVFNHDSEMVQLVLDIVFQILAIQGVRTEQSKQFGGSEKREGQPSQRSEKGPDRKFYYGPGQNPPFLLAPSADSLQAVLIFRDHLILQLYRMAMLQVIIRDVKVAETAEGKARDWKDTEKNLRKFARQLEDVEQEIMDVAGAKVGSVLKLENPGEQEVPTISYPKEFDIAAFEKLISDVFDMLDLPVGVETAVKEVGRLIRKRFPEVKGDDLKKLMDSMEGELRSIRGAAPITDDEDDDASSDQE